MNVKGKKVKIEVKICVLNLQEEYGQLSRKIQNASKKLNPCPLVGEYEVFSKTQPRNHPSIIKVHCIKHFCKPVCEMPKFLI